MRTNKTPAFLKGQIIPISLGKSGSQIRVITILEKVCCLTFVPVFFSSYRHQ